MDVYDAVVEFKNQYVATFDDVNDAINTGLYKSLDAWLTQNESMFQEYQAILEQY